jgi:hypothetical protein
MITPKTRECELGDRKKEEKRAEEDDDHSHASGVWIEMEWKLTE